MPRPDNITPNDIKRWDEIIDNDPLMTPSLAQNAIIREVCYSGQWMMEKLNELNCPDHLIGQIMFSAGKACFGQPDPWQIHQDILQQFINKTLIFEVDNECN